jgi:hypothetical protein
MPPNRTVVTIGMSGYMQAVPAISKPASRKLSSPLTLRPTADGGLTPKDVGGFSGTPTPVSAPLV